MRSNDFKRILELSKNEAHYKNPFVIDILPELDDNLKKDNQICYIRFYVKDCN